MYDESLICTTFVGDGCLTLLLLEVTIFGLDRSDD